MSDLERRIRRAARARSGLALLAAALLPAAAAAQITRVANTTL